MTAKVKLNYLGVDLITPEAIGVCRGKAVPWPPRVGAEASCKPLPRCWPRKWVVRSFEDTAPLWLLLTEDGQPLRAHPRGLEMASDCGHLLCARRCAEHFAWTVLD